MPNKIAKPRKELMMALKAPEKLIKIVEHSTKFATAIKEK
jgi:hypothetical protein